MGCMLKKRCVCWRIICWPLAASTIQEAHSCRSAVRLASFHISLYAQHDFSLHSDAKPLGFWLVLFPRLHNVSFTGCRCGKICA